MKMIREQTKLQILTGCHFLAHPVYGAFESELSELKPKKIVLSGNMAKK